MYACYPLLCLGLWLGLISPSPAAAPALWNADAQGHFITCICSDRQNHVWVGTEDGQGLWSYDPDAKAWTHFPASPDLSGDIYAVACDKAGRIWAGGLSGVSVYNGKQWRQYGPTDGPLGTRLFALAVNPQDGAVWGATEAGLFRYTNSHWTYYTRAEGLPSDQAQALAFDRDGTLYVGTQCDGIAVGSPVNDYKTWRVATGPRHLPNRATGSGLPSSLINCLLVTHDGTVYAGTTCGLASSVDKGRTWHYRRGEDWKDKLAGLTDPVPPVPTALEGHLLREDYISCLAEDNDRSLWVGHRQKGVELYYRDPKHQLIPDTSDTLKDDYITCLLPEGPGLWVGNYSNGLTRQYAQDTYASTPTPSGDTVPLPVPAMPPTADNLSVMSARVKSLKAEMPVGGAAFLGEDWQTLGDWVGHYGHQYALLCSIASPFDQMITRQTGYDVKGEIGTHITGYDALRHWIQPNMINTSRLGTLYSPVDGFRTQAEWDDHGEAYSQAYEGPDIWVTVTVPEGVYHVSLYDTNKDGHDSGNWDRDYQIDLLPFRLNLNDAQLQTPLAHARVHDFWNGCYTTFVVRGPSKYYIHLAKNNSKNTLLSGVFIDKVAGPTSWMDRFPMAFMGIIHFDPPSLASKHTPPSANTPPMLAAQSLWSALNASQIDTGDAALLTYYRTLALRAAQASGGSDPLLQNWRWNLNIWQGDDHQTFLNYMRAAHATLGMTVDDPRLHPDD